ncbi:MAG TPA: hypothetical protein VK110_10300, partial [Salinisphaeraceae bacterium]|nr:hypothetical protein [Salinisphaeraceae bacterium]
MTETLFADPVQYLRETDAREDFDADMAAEAFAACIESGDTATLRAWLDQALAVDVAEALDRLDPEITAAV